MTVERDGYNGPVVFRCDGTRCHEFHETHVRDFSDALADARAEGWRVVRTDNEWEHLCPECAT